MSLSSRDEAALRSCEALLTDGDPGLAETARFFEQVVGAEPMPRNERITSWRPRPGARLVAWLPSLIALAALAAGRFAWRAAHGAVRAWSRRRYGTQSRWAPPKQQPSPASMSPAGASLSLVPGTDSRAHSARIRSRDLSRARSEGSRRSEPPEPAPGQRLAEAGPRRPGHRSGPPGASLARIRRPVSSGSDR